MSQGLFSAADKVDQAFLFIFGVSVAILVLITLCMIWFVYRYHHTRNPHATDIKGNVAAEITWTVIPTILVMAMFWYGWTSYKALRSVPADAMKVKLTARMWSWVFEYENGKRTSVLTVPKERAVRLDMTSVDVIHSFFVPAFRIKIDTVPGMETYAWFESSRTGTFDILCAEYCGLRHANMLSTVEVVEKDAFEKWYNSTDDADEEVRKVLDTHGCLGCHSMDGSEVAGPTLKDLFGKDRNVLINGQKKTIPADEGYMRRAILEPEVEVLEGHEPSMPPYKDVLPEKDMDLIMKYLTGGAKRDLNVGRKLMEAEGCLSCHSTDGSEIAGPTLQNISGRKVVLKNGSEVTADDAYLKEAIIEPEKQMVKGYDNIMPPYPQLKEEDVKAMIDYMHSLSGGHAQ